MNSHSIRSTDSASAEAKSAKAAPNSATYSSTRAPRPRCQEWRRCSPTRSTRMSAWRSGGSGGSQPRRSRTAGTAWPAHAARNFCRHSSHAVSSGGGALGLAEGEVSDVMLFLFGAGPVREQLVHLLFQHLHAPQPEPDLAGDVVVRQALEAQLYNLHRFFVNGAQHGEQIVEPAGDVGD